MRRGPCFTLMRSGAPAAGMMQAGYATGMRRRAVRAGYATGGMMGSAVRGMSRGARSGVRNGVGGVTRGVVHGVACDAMMRGFCGPRFCVRGGVMRRQRRGLGVHGDA